MFHLDLCLEYMEIVDKQIVDEIPKIFIMMLVHKVNLNLGSIIKLICRGISDVYVLKSKA